MKYLQSFVKKPKTKPNEKEEKDRKILVLELV
jgi:hypothetical protein